MKKRIFKLLSFVLTLGSFFMFTLTNVKAEKVTVKFDYQDNVYYTRIGDGLNDSHQYLYYSLNGTPAFCIEPGVPINDWDYITGDISSSPFNDEITNKMVLIGHYGYDYPGHQTQKYRMATQALIWETARNLKVEFYTKINAGGNYIDISAEKNEIMRLVNSHYDKPSFNGNTLNTTLKKEVVIEDVSNNLSNYKVIDDGGNTVSIEGNKLHIIPNSFHNSTVILEKQKYDNKTTIIYTGENGKSQKLARFRYSDPVNAFVTLNTSGGTISIKKIDSETTTPSGEATLFGAVYGIYDENNNLLTKVTTDENGNATSEVLNRLGRFSIKELSASTGYLVDDTTYYATITENELNPSVVVKEQIIKGKIKVTKLDSENNSCKSQGEASLSGAIFEIKDKNNNIVDTLTIDDDCNAISKDLPYGNYNIYEKKSGKGYYINEQNFNIFIKEPINDIVVRATESEITNNYEITVPEDVIKNDFIFNKFYGKEGTGFIYTESNAVFEIVDYKNEVVKTFTTDNNGSAKVTLPYGNYKVRQIKGLEEYKMMGTFDISVNEKSNLTQTINIKNGEITAKLKLIKVDSDTKKTIKLAGFKFKIKNTKTNEYVCQATDKVVCEYETNDEGILLTPLPLFYGDYEIEEIKTQPNYLLSTSNVNFSIRDDEKIIYDQTYGFIIEINFENKAVKGKVNITKYGEKFIVENGTFKYEKQLLDGVSFKLYANEEIKLQDGTIMYNKNDVVSEFKVKDGKHSIENLPLGKYCLIETSNENKYIIDEKPNCFELQYKDDKTPVIDINLTIDNYLKKSDVVFTKTDLVDDNPIPNTLMELYTENNELIFRGRTDDSGKITIKNLSIGRYYFLEKDAPEGYLLNNEKLFFEIKEDGEVVKTEMKDERVIGIINIHKDGEKDSITDNCKNNESCFVYETKRNLKGIHFGLFANEDIVLNNITRYSKGDLIADDYTDDDGNLTFGRLYLGKYIIKELDTLDNLVLDNKEYEVILDYVDSKTASIDKSFVLKNYMIKSDLVFTKTDLVDDTPLPNTLIEIYLDNSDSDDTLIFKGYTDEEGKITIKNIPSGKYYLLEVEAPKGYVLNEEPMYFEIKEDGEVVKAEMKDEKIKSTIVIHKLGDDNNTLSGVKIGIFDLDDNLLHECYTDEFGNIEIELEYGKYYYQELESIDGYELNSEKIFFEVIEDKAIIETSLINIKVPSTGLNDYHLYEVIGSLLILSGLGVALYVSKKKKNK